MGNDRQADLAHLEGQIKELASEMQQVRTAYQTYHGEVAVTIKDIMTKAGVFNEVNELERERVAAGERAQKKAQELQQKMQELQKIRAFLVSREQTDKVEPPREEISEPPENTEENTAAETEESVWDSPNDEEGPAEETSEDAAKRPTPPAF